MANPSHRAVTVSQSLTELNPDLVVGTQVADNARCDARPGQREKSDWETFLQLTLPPGKEGCT